MTEVYVIRHAEAEGNYYLRAMGSFDSDLTRLGRQQLKYLAKRFEGVRLNAIYASTLYRSQETARAVAAVSGLPVRIEPEIREIHVGVWEDRPWGNLTREYPEMMRRYNSDPMRWHVEGCESSRHVQERMLRAIKDLARRHDGGAVAAVSHGCAIRLLLAGIRGIPSEEMRWSLHSDNTAVTLLRIEGDDVEIVYEGDSSHLPLEYSRFARQKWWTEEGAEHPEPYLRPWDPEKDAELYVSLYRDAWACAHGHARTAAPTAISARKPNAIEKRRFITSSRGARPPRPRARRGCRAESPS